jgi:hypothetical protein
MKITSIPYEGVVKMYYEKWELPNKLRQFMEYFYYAVKKNDKELLKVCINEIRELRLTYHYYNCI